ncbi:hypothetical protein [Spirosoma pollinicola]|uniref:DUF3887 domain-containing protein n=1 Tax=Spirosoma pollinicola TaxID=2057025 RepID=A0A2K8ZA38_9BACT|nr:hypothetical protein [Spirosoma pollinicola]AUD06743.1 hypothetical protein CWM47_35810 [Spirosoma pollinicola]
MKHTTLFLIAGLLAHVAQAQTFRASPTNSKLDSLAKLAQRFTNNNQPDSLYALMGDDFKKAISIDKVKQVLGEINQAAGEWISLESQAVKDGVSHYKAVFKLMSFNFYISQDKQGKIYTYLFKPL